MLPRCPRVTVVVLLLTTLLSASAAMAAPAPAPTWKAGVAAADITPELPIWTAGYGPRTIRPTDRLVQPLFAKAVAFEDALGTRMVIVTLDLIGIPRVMRDAVAQGVQERYQLPPEAILLNASHTHSGPVLTRGGIPDPVYAEKAEAYRVKLEARLIELVGEALGRLEPAELHYSHARAGFAMNRRLPIRGTFGNSPYPDGLVDHDVPVLRVNGADGKTRAILFGYACHNTATGHYYVISGDYAGYAQQYLQEEYPGAVAMFVMGAGGDQNAYPRHKTTLEQPGQHGRTLANAVIAALAVMNPRPVGGPLRSAFAYVTLDFAGVSRDELQRRTRSLAAGEKERAQQLLRRLDAGEQLPTGYPCPVQVVRFGTDLIMTAVGGETTVDYSLRVKRELAGGPAAVWFAGYSNEVFGYLGGRRVIVEGGYEGYSSNAGRFPGPWAVDTEERIVETILDLLRTINH